MGLSLTLLGGLTICDTSGRSVSLPTRKTRALLAYLVANADRAQSRERLAALLWSDRSDQQARRSLSQALMVIRKLDAGILLKGDGDHVTLRSDAIESDVQRFRLFLRDQPSEAAVMYGGPFLDGFSVPVRAFEAWQFEMRSELQALACAALQRATDDAAKSGEMNRAIDHARRIVALDPLCEEAHRRLMLLLTQTGDRAGALRQYQACANILRCELQVEPDQATIALFEEIRRNARPTPKPQPIPAIPRGRELPDEPSLAVLPFDVIGGDPQTSDLADGLVEDLITALVKVREMLVIDRHSTGRYGGQSANVQDVAKALGVRYVLSGRIQTVGDRLRCSAQLFDTISGRHLWAERYDRTVDDIFALQDEIVWLILVELQVRLTEGESARIASRGTRNLEAWLLRVQGANELGRVTREGCIRARTLFEAAHKVDPNWARPLAGIAATHFFEAQYHWSSSRDKSIATGIEYAERGLAMDPDEPFVYVILRCLKYLVGRHDEALEIIKKAAALAPNDQLVVGNVAMQLMYMDEIDEAVRTFGSMMRLGPIPHISNQRGYGLALMLAGRADHAIEILENLVRSEPNWRHGHIYLAAAYANAGRIDQAHTITRRVLKEDPTHTASFYVSLHIFQNPERTEWLRDLLIKAGLPE